MKYVQSQCAVWVFFLAVLISIVGTTDTRAQQGSATSPGGKSDPNKIKTRVFYILDQPHPAVKGPEPKGDEPRKYFESQGVNFPEGTSALFDEENHLLVVTHTELGLEAIRKVLERANCLPSQITIETRFLQMPRTLAEDLFADDEGLSRACIIKEIILKRIDEFARNGKITELARPKLTTVSSNTAQVKAVKELHYPTEFIAARGVTDTNRPSSIGSAFVAITPATPGAFETREIGYLLNVTPTLGPDGSTLNITLVPEVSRVAPKPRQYSITTPSGKVTVEQPEFSSYQTTTTVQIKSGQTMLLAVMDPVAEDGKLTQNDVVFVLLSASVIRE